MGKNILKREINLHESKDYFDLYVPLQTQQYIFRMIACKMIMENLRKYGFDLGIVSK
jgi:membrane-bound lytic murein transglycosylase D